MSDQPSLTAEGGTPKRDDSLACSRDRPVSAMVTASPAVLLREAASKMRELAQAATPGPWRSWNDGHVGSRRTAYGGLLMPTTGCPVPHEERIANAVHIAAWHPGVALAVADWLEMVAARHTEATARTTEECWRTSCCEEGCEVTYCEACGRIVDDTPCPDVAAALGVARVYLGRTDE